MREHKASAVLFGITLAGFLDGIALHSILQWHHMISGRIAADDMQGMRVNMLADGLFDLFCWVLTIVALILLFREAKRRAVPQAKRYTGWILVGAGLFNLVEGILDHELLGLHHVHPQSHWLAWGIGFLIVGGLLPLAIGWMLREEQQTKVIPMRPAA